MNNGKKISLIIPMYNNERTIKACVESCYDQDYENYEIIVVDNKSTDKSIKIASQMGASNYHLLGKSDNTNLADTLNVGLEFAKGDIIIFVDPTKKLRKNILSKIDLGDYDLMFINSHYKESSDITFKDVLDGKLDYNSIVISSSYKDKMPYYFEAYYHNNEKYRFCVNFASRDNVKIKQEKGFLYTVDTYKLTNSKLMKKLFNATNDGELTCIVTFRCEKTEVERTVCSLRYTAKNVKILLMDDDSDDNYDYQRIANLYHCDYHRNKERRGSAGSKHDGANMCTTPYFCFFDGHQRVYNQNWDTRLLNLLKENPFSILAARTIYISQDKNGVYVNEDARNKNYNGGASENYCGINACCYVQSTPSYEFDPKWVTKFEDNDPSHDLSPVPCVLGAVYAMSTNWWKYIKGYYGLVIYGLEETFMCSKTWLAGGSCFVIKDWGVGHLYRDKNASYIDPSNVDANRMYLMHFFSTDQTLINAHKQMLLNRIGQKAYDEAVAVFDKYQKDIVDEEREYFFNNIARYSVDTFLKFNEAVKQHNEPNEKT